MIMPIPESVNTLQPMASSSDTLRLELKAWEKEFAAAHQGRKASREDIKQNLEIGIYLCIFINAAISFYPKSSQESRTLLTSVFLRNSA